MFEAKSSAASLTIRVTLANNHNAPALLSWESETQERFYTLFETVNYLLRLYATKGVISKAATMTGLFLKRTSQTAVRLVEEQKNKALRCGDVFFKQWTDFIFLKG